MKSKLKIFAAALCLVALSARAQVTPTTIFVLTNLPAVIPGNTTTNLFVASQQIPTTNVISLRQGQGMAAAMTYNGTNAATSLGFSIN